MSFLETVDRRFHITRRNSTILQEANGGLSDFLSMVYIIPVSAGMYAAVGCNHSAAAMSIALATALITLLMGFYANIPVGLSTGMGLNAFAVFTVCLGMGYSFELVMICTLIEGIIFFILSLTGVRSALANSLPAVLKSFIGAGIGGFLMFIGAQNAKLIIDSPSTLVTMVNFRDNFSTVGVTATLTVVGVFIIAVLMAMKSKAAVIAGIAIAWILGIICQFAGIYVPDPEAGFYSLYPAFQMPDLAAISEMVLDPRKVKFSLAMLGDVLIVVGIMFYSDFFDTVGTCVTCLRAIVAAMREEIAELRERHSESANTKIRCMEAEVKAIESERTTKRAFLVDATGTMLCSLLKCTTVTSFVESMAGIAAGARTGFASVVNGGLFLLCIFFSSIFTTVPGYATGAALIVVGCSMFFGSLKQIEWKVAKFNELFSGVMCAVFMVLTYNIANGIAAGIISYTIVTPFTKSSEKVKPIFWVLSFLLVLKFIFL